MTTLWMTSAHLRKKSQLFSAWESEGTCASAAELPHSLGFFTILFMACCHMTSAADTMLLYQQFSLNKIAPKQPDFTACICLGITIPLRLWCWKQAFMQSSLTRRLAYNHPENTTTIAELLQTQDYNGNNLLKTQSRGCTEQIVKLNKNFTKWMIHLVSGFIVRTPPLTGGRKTHQIAASHEYKRGASGIIEGEMWDFYVCVNLILKDFFIIKMN